MARAVPEPSISSVGRGAIVLGMSPNGPLLYPNTLSPTETEVTPLPTATTGERAELESFN